MMVMPFTHPVRVKRRFTPSKEPKALRNASSPKRSGLPGWELTERDGSTAERRSLRLTADDLRAAAEHEADRD